MPFATDFPGSVKCRVQMLLVGVILEHDRQVSIPLTMVPLQQNIGGAHARGKPLFDRCEMHLFVKVAVAQPVPPLQPLLGQGQGLPGDIENRAGS